MLTFEVTIKSLAALEELNKWLYEHKTSSKERLEAWIYSVTIHGDAEESFFDMCEEIGTKTRLL